MAIGHALLTGLRINRFLAPEIFTPALFERAFEPFADLCPEPSLAISVPTRSELPRRSGQDC